MHTRYCSFQILKFKITTSKVLIINLEVFLKILNYKISYNLFSLYTILFLRLKKIVYKICLKRYLEIVVFMYYTNKYIVVTTMDLLSTWRGYSWLFISKEITCRNNFFERLKNRINAYLCFHERVRR